MPRGKNILKTSNVNYIGRDFNDLKTSLMQYTKSYFPNTYKDFNETSPGMMLLEMSAYVGDVLNFYVDQQYREMLLPLSEDRRNLIVLANAQGYKTRTTSPAYADLTIKQSMTADSITGTPNWGEAVTINKGMTVAATTDPNLLFETLDVVDFKASSSADLEPEVTLVNPATGMPAEYIFTRKVKSINSETKTTTFTVGIISMKKSRININDKTSFQSENTETR